LDRLTARVIRLRLSLPNSSAISIVFFSNNKLANRTHIPPLYMLHCYLMHACVLYSTHSTAVVDFAYIYIYIYIYTHTLHACRARAGRPSHSHPSPVLSAQLMHPANANGQGCFISVLHRPMDPTHQFISHANTVYKSSFIGFHKLIN
jgi:hypothetical protein